MSVEPGTLPVKELAAAIHDQAYPSHPYFPQLKIASEPRLMLELFGQHLRPAHPASTKAFEIEECVPVRFRFRRDGTSCVLQYALRLGAKSRTADEDEHKKANRESGSGLILSNVCVTCVIYAEAGEARKAYAEVQRIDPNIPHSWATFEPLALIPELQMVVYVFPYDRSVPRLPLILSGPW